MNLTEKEIDCIASCVLSYLNGGPSALNCDFSEFCLVVAFDVFTKSPKKVRQTMTPILSKFIKTNFPHLQALRF